MSFNELLEECGEFGLYQKLMTFGYLAPASVLLSFILWTQVFILLVPPHRCRITPWDNSWTFLNDSDILASVASQCYINVSSFNNTVGGNFSTELPNSDSEVITCPYGWVYDFSVQYPTFATEHNWVCDDAWRMYTVHTCYWIGSILGSLSFGFISDILGRKKSYQLAIIITMTSNIMTFFAKSPVLFYIARMCSAFGDRSITPLAFVLVTEYTGPSKRKIIIVVWSMTFTIASTILPWMVYLLQNWKYILIACWVPSICALIISIFIPESASWLMTRGRMQEAAKLVHRMSRINGKELTLSDIESRLKNEAQQYQNGGVKSTERKSEILTGSSEKMTFLESTIGLLKTPNMRKKTILLIVLCMIATTTYNGNNLEQIHLPVQFYLAYSIGAIMELPGNVFCMLALDRIGRRWTTSGAFIIGGILGIMCRCVDNTVVILVMAMIMRCCYAVSIDVSFTFTSELLPTVVRGRGIFVIETLGSIGASFSPNIVSLSEKDPLIPLVILGTLAILGGLLTLYLPETAMQHLPHSLEEGEDFGKDQSFWLCPYNAEKDSTMQFECSQNMPDICDKKTRTKEKEEEICVKIIIMKPLPEND